MSSNVLDGCRLRLSTTALHSTYYTPMPHVKREEMFYCLFVGTTLHFETRWRLISAYGSRSVTNSSFNFPKVRMRTGCSEDTIVLIYWLTAFFMFFS